MRRREFIKLIGGAAAAWPLAARAQQGGKVWRIGLLSGASREGASPNYDAFLQGMRDLGYAEGRDFILEARFAGGRYERFPELAAELVRLKVDVLVTGTAAAIRTLQRATTTIPIVLAYSTDPVGNGFVASLALALRRSWTRFSKAPAPAACQSSSPRGSTSSSTARQRTRSESPYRRSSISSPTR
jgi:putative tryptophan/tyrosine transport system substrate-binding protein